MKIFQTSSKSVFEKTHSCLTKVPIRDWVTARKRSSLVTKCIQDQESSLAALTVGRSRDQESNDARAIMQSVHWQVGKSGFAETADRSGTLCARM